MSDNVKHSCIWASAIVLTATPIAWAIAWYNTTVTTVAMENGYSEQSQPGAYGVHWVKDPE